MSNYVVSLIRTWVPLAAGWVGLFVANALGVQIDEAALSALLITVISGVWYAIARWLEARFPWAGYLLGVPKQPVYPEPVEVIGDVARIPEEFTV